MKYLNPPRVWNLSPKKPTQKQTGWRLKFSHQNGGSRYVCLSLRLTWYQYINFKLLAELKDLRNTESTSFLGDAFQQKSMEKDYNLRICSTNKPSASRKIKLGNWMHLFFPSGMASTKQNIKRCKLHTRCVLLWLQTHDFCWFQRCLAEKPKTQTLHWSNGAWGIGEVMVRDGKSASDLQSLPFALWHSSSLYINIYIYIMQFLGRSLKYGSILLYIKSMLRINNSHI